MIKPSLSRVIFQICNVTILSMAALLCLLPILHVLALSLSSAEQAAKGLVGIWPVDFTWRSYEYVAQRSDFWQAFQVSFMRIAIALPLTLIVTVMTAYPLSRSSRKFRGRMIYVSLLIIPMLFGGGLIPWFLTMKAVGMTGTIWGLVIPGLVVPYYCILLLNFFRELPDEMEEAALIDGAGPMGVLFKVFIPTSTPVLATISLFIIVSTWNEWFQAIILMSFPEQYPLQTFLRSILAPPVLINTTSVEDLEQLREISDRTLKAAQIFISMIPVLVVYPFLQKYFTKGIVLGSVKG